MACITMLNKIGLSTDPWCTPTLTSKLSLSSPFLFDRCSNPLIQTFNHIYHPLCHSNMPQSPPQNLTRHPIEGLLQVYKSHPQKGPKTHLRKNESPRKYGARLKNHTQSHAPLRWGWSCGENHDRLTPWLFR